MRDIEDYNHLARQLWRFCRRHGNVIDLDQGELAALERVIEAPHQRHPNLERMRDNVQRLRVIARMTEAIRQMVGTSLEVTLDAFLSPQSTVPAASTSTVAGQVVTAPAIIGSAVSAPAVMNQAMVPPTSVTQPGNSRRSAATSRDKTSAKDQTSRKRSRTPSKVQENRSKIPRLMLSRRHVWRF